MYTTHNYRFFNLLNIYNNIINYLIMNLYYYYLLWGLGIGDWGLGIGDWAQSPIPIIEFIYKTIKK